jgi:hypothetical protein
MDEDKKITVDGREVSESDFFDMKESLPKDKRLVEVSPGQYRTLSRLNG